MEALLVVRVVVAAPQGFAVDGHDLALDGCDQVARSGQEAVLEGGRIQRGQDPAAGVVGGDAASECEKGAPSGSFAAPKLGDTGPGVGAPDHRAEFHGHHLQQIMTLAVVNPRIGQVAHVGAEGILGQQVDGTLLDRSGQVAPREAAVLPSPLKLPPIPLMPLPCGGGAIAGRSSAYGETTPRPGASTGLRRFRPCPKPGGQRAAHPRPTNRWEFRLPGACQRKSVR